MSTASIQESPAPGASLRKTTVSVVIPAFNAAAYLGEALESVFAQTYQPLEVIVVDDGSEDDTPRVVAAYAGKVTYIRKQRGGPASARNAGIRAAKGEWIAFQDADDIWLPNLLGKLVKGALETGADLVFCDALTLRDGRIVRPSRLERSGLMSRLNTLATASVLVNPFDLILEGCCYILPTGVLVRRDALLQIGLFDEGFYSYEDVDLWLRLSLTHRFAVLKDVLHLRRIHARNMSQDRLALLTGEIKVYEKLERHSPTVPPATRWGERLLKRKASLLREQGALHLERGELLLARRSWAKGFHTSYSARLAAYWLATFLPQPWVETLRNRKRQIWRVPSASAHLGREVLA